jgi:hypothetical protein
MTSIPAFISFIKIGYDPKKLSRLAGAGGVHE